MSRKKPDIISVMQSLMVLNTYCHYEDCKYCIFFFNGENALFKNKDNTKTCFLHAECWCLHKFELLCDYIEHIMNLEFCLETDTKKARIKYKLALILLQEWNHEYNHLTFIEYLELIESKTYVQEHKAMFLKLIIEEIK